MWGQESIRNLLILEKNCKLILNKNLIIARRRKVKNNKFSSEIY
jgi:hypothetical protein